jgi:hypothetical protein
MFVSEDNATLTDSETERLHQSARTWLQSYRMLPCMTSTLAGGVENRGTVGSSALARSYVNVCVRACMFVCCVFVCACAHGCVCVVCVGTLES